MLGGRDASRINVMLRKLRGPIAIAGVVLPGGVLAFACTTDYQRGADDPKFGAPNALAGQKQPGSTADNARPGGGSTSGGEGGAGSSGTGPRCVQSGGAIVDGGPCTVSFTKDVLAAFGAVNATCGISGCHGGATPANLPPIDPGNASGNMYDEFQKFTASNGKPYINPCSTDPAQSAIACNVNKAAPCGALMPQGNANGLPADVVTKLETWLKCGSPNN